MVTRELSALSAIGLAAALEGATDAADVPAMTGRLRDQIFTFATGSAGKVSERD
jgi:hypothetical protein